jgi:hypothetical protein
MNQATTYKRLPRRSAPRNDKCGFDKSNPHKRCGFNESNPYKNIK